jgi:hypothetical protein
MSRFYGTVNGSAQTEATRRGNAKTGITTHAASWKGAVRVCVHYDKSMDLEHYTVELVPWKGSGPRKLLAEGVMGDG